MYGQGLEPSRILHLSFARCCRSLRCCRPPADHQIVFNRCLSVSRSFFLHRRTLRRSLYLFPCVWSVLIFLDQHLCEMLSSLLSDILSSAQHLTLHCAHHLSSATSLFTLQVSLATHLNTKGILFLFPARDCLQVFFFQRSIIDRVVFYQAPIPLGSLLRTCGPQKSRLFCEMVPPCFSLTSSQRQRVRGRASMQLPCPFRATILISNNSRLTRDALSLTQLMQHVGTSPSDGSHRIGRVFNVANRSFLGAWHVFSSSYLFLDPTRGGDIAPHIFTDVDGSRYFVWKSEDNRLGLPTTHIWAV